MKFALELLGLSAGFLCWGSVNASDSNLVSPAWLIVMYFLHTVGELCLSPVGLSSMTKLLQKSDESNDGDLVVAAALGNLIAGSSRTTRKPYLQSVPSSRLICRWRRGVIAILAAPSVKKLMGDIE